MQIDTTVHLSHARSKLMHILLTMVLVMAPFFTDIAIADDFSGIQNQLSTQENTQSGKKISGVVLDKSGIPITGVSVAVKGTKVGTVTDIDGKFTLTVPSNVSNLVFTFIGMKQQTVPIANKTNLTVTMEEESVNIDEVVVVGYGKQKKATVTGAVSMVQTKELVQSSQANISNALVGRMPGLLAVQKSGEPGNDQSTIRIRGIGSFATDDNVDLQAPLVMVDGIETPNYNNIDPNEIENVSILKDASATAVYGVRGANGVILITTKRGRVAKPKVSFSTNFALSSFANLRKQMNAYDYARSFNEAISYDGYLTGNYTPKYSEEDIQLYKDHSDPLFHSDTDWIGLIFRKHSLQTQHNINITGGTEKVKYFASVGAFTQQGLYNNTDMIDGFNTQVRYNRYNFRTNFDFQVTDRFSVNLNISDQLEDRKGPSDSTPYILANAFAHPPTSGPGVVDGKIIENLDGEYGFIENPLKGLVIGHGHLHEYRNQLNGSVRFNYKLDFLTKGLSTHATISYQNYNTHTIRYVKNMVTYKLIGDKNNPIFIPQGQDGNFETNEIFGKNRKVYIEAGFDYARTFGKHSVGGLILYNQSKYYDPGLAYLIPNAYQGIVGRITYDYANRYLAEFNMGYNGTENFRAGKRFGFFPAFSLGWVLSEENFFPKNDAVSFIKIRGSYGEVGNDKIGGERFLYRPTAYVFNSASGNNNDNCAYWFGTVGQNYTLYTTSSEGKIGNPDLTWERAKKMNIGIDLSLWNDRIKLTADYFQEKRDDILANRGTIPDIVGANLPAYNMGKMENKGFDGEITFRDHIGPFNYWLRGIFTFARNEIKFMDESNKLYAYQKRTGHRLNQYFGYIAEGFYNTWEEVNDINRPESMYNNNKIQPGDVKYKDVNGDGIINTYDQVPIGYSDFPEISYGISLGGDIKGFDFSILFQGSSHVSFRASKKSNRGFQEDGSAVDYLKDYSWTPERYANGDEIKFPHLSANASQEHNYQASSLWIRDASYLRLKNVEIGYTFSGKILKKIGLDSARIYVNGTNLVTWCDLFPGEDPEIPTYNDGNYEPYPIVKTVNMGLNVNF